jgi:hypothetical protein
MVMPSESTRARVPAIPEIVDALHMSKPHAYRLVKSGARRGAVWLLEC